MKEFADKRQKVQLPGDGHLLSDCAIEMGKILAEQNIFSRGGSVFKVSESKDGLALMTPDIFRTWVEDYLVLFRIRRPGGADEAVQFKKTISVGDATGILASPQFLEQLQPIERFNPIRVPVIDRWGYVKLLDEGYDEFTKSFTADTVPIMPNLPMEFARQIIDENLSEFVFADNRRSKAVVIAAALTVFGRGLLPSKALRPCFIFLANAPGAGKTLLVKFCTVPMLGFSPAGTKPRDEDEMKKLLLASVVEARTVLFFDNVKGHFSSAALEGFLTAQDYEGRILGQTKTFRGANDAVVFITGNACTVSPDMRRRSLFVELFLEAERAEERVFKNNLEVPELLARRSEILSAFWALIQHWDKDMRPRPSRSNSSFPEWSEVIGGIVEHAGYGCPLDIPQIEAAADQDGADMRSLVEAIGNGSTMKLVQFDEIIEVARSAGLFEWIVPASGDLDGRAKSTLGKLLKSFDRRLIGDHRFSLEGKGHARRFKVELHGGKVCKVFPAI